MRNLIVAAAIIGVGGYFGAKFYIQHKAARDLDSLLAQAPVVAAGVIKSDAIGSLATQLAANASGTTLQYGPVLSGGAGSAIKAWDCFNGTTILPKYLPAVCRAAPI